MRERIPSDFFPNLAEALSEITDYIKEQKIEVIVIPGKSAFIARDLLKEYWKQTNHPFFKTMKFFSLGHLVSTCISKSSCPRRNEPEDIIISKESIDLFKENAPSNLLKQKNKNILLFDELLYSGQTLTFMHNLLRKLGFKSVKRSALSSVEISPKVTRIVESRKVFFVPKVFSNKRLQNLTDLVYSRRKNLFFHLVFDSVSKKGAKKESEKNKEFVTAFGKKVRKNLRRI